MKLELRKDIMKFKGNNAGLVKKTFTHARSRDTPSSVYNVSVSYSDFNYLEGIDKVSLRPGSSKTDRKEAQRAAIGEVVERYAKYYTHKTKTRKVEDEKYLWLEKNECKNTNFKPLRLGEEVQHIKGALLEDNTVKEVPAQYVISNINEKRSYGYAFSVGMATSHTAKEGIKHGLSEQLERDLAIKAWNRPESLVQIDPDEFQTPDFDADLYHVKNKFKAPMILAVSYVRDVPCFSFGLDQSLEYSVKEALIENIQVKSNVRGELIRESNPFPETAKKTIVNERLSAADQISIETSSLETVLDQLKDEFSPVGFDLTPPEIDEEGFKVTKVIIPELRQFSRPKPMFTGNERFRSSDASVPPFFHY